MKLQRATTYYICIIITFFVFSQQALALDDPSTRETLRGLGGVLVGIETIKIEVEQYDLTTVQINADVELKFQSAGIKVLSLEEWQHAPGNPALNVLVSVNHIMGEYFYIIEIELKQLVVLSRDTGIEQFLSTWSTEGRGIATDLSDIRPNINSKLDEFINAYLSVNPK